MFIIKIFKKKIYLFEFLIKFTTIIYVKIYQKTISFTDKKCNFFPSCSNYVLIKIEKTNIIKTAVKSIFRIIKCSIRSEKKN